LETVIPNLERFPEMGRLFLARSINSIEVRNGLDLLYKQLNEVGKLGEIQGEIREYLLADYLILYARFSSGAKATKSTIYLLSIKHHRQLSFDFESFWDSSSA
jgi:hypothetical protein